MTLETLAKDIAKSAEAEVSAMVKAANEEAKAILAEANSKSMPFAQASARTEREASQIAREVVASARQANQKEISLLDAKFSMRHCKQPAKNLQARNSREGLVCSSH